MDLEVHSNKIFKVVEQLIIAAQKRVAVFVNAETTLLYWGIGNYINTEIKDTGSSGYGRQIVANTVATINPNVWQRIYLYCPNPDV